jgi:nucleoside-diphosphate-sugar epimerase
MGCDFLVTGAAGFVGANLCRRLREAGGDTHAVLRPGSDAWRLDGIVGDLQVHEADLTSPQAIAQVIGKARPRIVYHLATHGAYPFQKDMSRIVLSNVSGMVHLAEACTNAGVELLVNTGSSSEYGRKLYAMRETDPLKPDSYYAVSKCAQTLLCQALARQVDLPVVTLRLFSVYGPYEEPTRLFPTLMLRALRGEHLEMAAPETSRDFVHVDDVVDAYVMTDELMPATGEVLNIGTGVQSSLRDVVDRLSEAMGEPVRAEWGAMEARPWDTPTWVADVTKARRLIGWRPKIDLADGVARCLKWFGDHADLYDRRTRARC